MSISQHFMFNENGVCINPLVVEVWRSPGSGRIYAKYKLGQCLKTGQWFYGLEIQLGGPGWSYAGHPCSPKNGLFPEPGEAALKALCKMIDHVYSAWGCEIPEALREAIWANIRRLSTPQTTLFQ